MTDRIETQPDHFSLPDERARQLLAFAAVVVSRVAPL